MNCPICNNPIKPGAKFCTSCGKKLDESGNLCPKCNAPLKPDAKFCTKCGTRISQENPSNKQKLPEDMESSTERIYWNIQPGQVARVISEAEFESYGKVKGVIISEGTTAYIRANGRTIASISGGTYDFIDNNGASNTTGNNENIFRRGWNFITNLFKSKSKKEEKKEEENNGQLTAEQLYAQQQASIYENAKRGAAFSVVIILDKAFPLMIGAKQEHLDDYSNFVPMSIETKYTTIQVGVNAYFAIRDKERFITQYLTDKQIMNTALIVDEITDTIRVILQDELYDVELTSNRIPNEYHNRIKEKINAVANEAFYGISLVRIVEISAESKDLERFSVLSRELYLSEKELDYLHRTNDFKNRLADTENSQRIHEARTETELRRCLEEINRDNLLLDDEMQKFEYLLANERIIREAKSDDEREQALHEIKKTGLIREEEIEALRHKLKTEEYKRGTALAMMQLQDSIEFERIRLEGEADKAVIIAKKQIEVEMIRDNYTDERFYKELDKKRAAANACLDIEQRKLDMDFNQEKRRSELEREENDAQFQQFMAMQKAQEEAKQNERRHEIELEQTRLQHQQDTERIKWENAQNLSDEKVWALSGGEGAIAYAENKYSVEAERRANERVDAERAKRDEAYERMEERMFNMMEMAMNVGRDSQRAHSETQRANERLNEREQQIRERDERIRRQEGRMDTAYDRALDYTTRANAPQAVPTQQVAPQAPQTPQMQQTPPAAQQMPKTPALMICKECGAQLEEGSHFCDQCGANI